LWLGHGASISKLSAAFKYSKQLSKSNDHPILIGIDDPHIPGEQGDAREHWQDALNEITVELQTNNTEDTSSIPVIVCCSPTERKDIFQELNEVSVDIKIEFSPLGIEEKNHHLLRNWYRQRTGKEAPMNDDKNLLLVQLFFEFKSGDTIDKFAKNFKERIISSENAIDYKNKSIMKNSSHQRLYDLFSEILALNRLYTTYPEKAVEERLSNSGMEVFNQLIDDNHVNLFKGEFQNERGGYMLSHPHLANAIYECWHRTTNGKNRKKHLQSAIHASFKYGANDNEKVAPLWALSNALRPESPNLKRLLYAKLSDISSVSEISDNLNRMFIPSLLENIYEYYYTGISMSYLPVWIQIELRCKKIELNIEKVKKNSPVNIAIEKIERVASTKEVGLMPLCHKLLQFFDELEKEQQKKINNAFIALLEKYPDWEDWPFIFNKLRHSTSKEKFKDTKLVELGQNWLGNAPDNRYCQLVWHALPKYNEEKSYDAAIRWLENVPFHHSWPGIWQGVSKKSTAINHDDKIDTLNNLGEWWLEKVSDEFPMHHSWQSVWSDMMIIFEGNNEKLDKIIQIAKQWLNNTPEHHSWRHVWQQLINIDYVNNEELIQIAKQWLDKAPYQRSWQAICEAKEIPKDRDLANIIIRWLKKVPEHESWPYIWKYFLGNFSYDHSEYNEIINIGQEWLNENQRHSSWDIVWIFFFEKHIEDSLSYDLLINLGREYLKKSPGYIQGWSRTWNKLWNTLRNDSELIQIGIDWLQQADDKYTSPRLVWQHLRETNINNNYNLSRIGLRFLSRTFKFEDKEPRTSWLHIWKDLWIDKYDLDELRYLGEKWLKESILAAPKNLEWGSIWLMLWSNRPDETELIALANDCLNKLPNPPEVNEIRELIESYQTQL
jgi:hypothetical protein